MSIRNIFKGSHFIPSVVDLYKKESKDREVSWMKINNILRNTLMQVSLGQRTQCNIKGIEMSSF